jgi:hypothetical protein
LLTHIRKFRDILVDETTNELTKEGLYWSRLPKHVSGESSSSTSGSSSTNNNNNDDDSEELEDFDPETDDESDNEKFYDAQDNEQDIEDL